MASVHKSIKILGLGFMFVFIGYSGVQHYLTQHFESSGAKQVGFISLILIYLFITLSGPIASRIVLSAGSRMAMIYGALAYTIYVVSLMNTSPALIYAASALLGFGASLLWNGHGSYVIRASDASDYGRNVGFSISIKELGSAIGIFLFGLILKYYSNVSPFLFFALFPLVGILIIARLKPNHPAKHDSYKHSSFTKALMSPTALKLSLSGFSGMFVYGVIIGITPIEIRNMLGLDYIAVWGILGTLGPVLFSYHAGLLSDHIGRGKMILLSYSVGITGLLTVYFSTGQISFAIGVLILTAYAIITGGIGTALIGDASSDKNIESITGLFLAVRTLGTVSALLISLLTPGRTVYLLAVFLLAVTLSIITPILRLKPAELKQKLAGEIGNQL